MSPAMASRFLTSVPPGKSQEKGFVPRVNPMKSTTMEYLSGKEGHSIQAERDHEGKFWDRNTQVTLMN